MAPAIREFYDMEDFKIHETQEESRGGLTSCREGGECAADLDLHVLTSAVQYVYSVESHTSTSIRDSNHTSSCTLLQDDL